MARFSRRKFLQYSGATGMAGILASHRAPVFAQQSTVHWLKWNDFVPASDELLRKSMVGEASKALGIKLNLETVNEQKAVIDHVSEKLARLDLTVATIAESGSTMQTSRTPTPRRSSRSAARTASVSW